MAVEVRGGGAPSQGLKALDRCVDTEGTREGIQEQ